MKIPYQIRTFSKNRSWSNCVCWFQPDEKSKWYRLSFNGFIENMDNYTNPNGTIVSPEEFLKITIVANEEYFSGNPLTNEKLLIKMLTFDKLILIPLDKDNAIIVNNSGMTIGNKIYPLSVIDQLIDARDSILNK